MADNSQLYTNMLQVLTLNNTYTEFIARAIRKVEELIRRNKINQKFIQEKLHRMSVSTYGLPDGKSLKVTNSTCYSNPYFKDSGQICPPLSSEAGEILATTDVNCLMKPERPWRPADLKKLREQVQHSVVENYLLPLTSRAELLAEKISKSGVDTPEEMKDQLRANLQKLHTKINFSLSIGSNAIFLEQCRQDAGEAVDWQRISVITLNGERTVNQLRARWINDVSPRWSDRPWTRDEEDLLVELIDAREYEGNDWEAISKLLADAFGRRRSPYQCFQRWVDARHSDRRAKKYWTPEEDEILVGCVKAYKRLDLVNWAQISRSLPGRSKFMCELRYRRTLCETLRRGAWTRDEDQLLLDAVHKFGTSDWHLIAKFVPGRINLQCRNRYQNNLRDGLKEGMFSLEEDERLLFGVKTFGRHQLAIVARLLPDRGMDCIKARFRSFIKARIAGCRAQLDKRTRIVHCREANPLYNFMLFLEARRLEAEAVAQSDEAEEDTPAMLRRRVKCEPTTDGDEMMNGEGKTSTGLEAVNDEVPSSPPPVNPRSDGRWCMTLKGGWINVNRPTVDPLQKLVGAKRHELSRFIDSIHRHYGSAAKDMADGKRYERLSALLNSAFNLRPSDFNFVGVRLQRLLDDGEVIKANWPYQARRRRTYKNGNNNAKIKPATDSKWPRKRSCAKNKLESESEKKEVVESDDSDYEGGRCSLRMRATASAEKRRNPTAGGRAPKKALKEIPINGSGDALEAESAENSAALKERLQQELHPTRRMPTRLAAVRATANMKMQGLQ